ncbi:MAG: hypothetical protein Q8P33_00040, partial [bacterium]|nr:hypothetical protein [bacterium]
MVLARVIPATKLPLNTPQRYTYSVDDAAPGQLVSVPLGRRQVAGLIIELTEQAPAGVTLKRASKMAQTLPATYVS